MNLPRVNRALLRAAAATALLASFTGGGCTKTTTYSYVDVSVSIDPNTVTKKDLTSEVVASCEIRVTGADSADGVQLPSCPGNQSFDLGSFEWSTTAPSGTLQFTVTLFALNREVFATGTSDSVAIVAGKRTSGSVLVVGVRPDAGTGGDDSGVGGASATGGTSGGGGAGGMGGGSGGAGGAGGSSAGGAGGNDASGGQSAGGMAGTSAGGRGGSAGGVSGAAGGGGSAAGGTSGAGGG